MLRSLLNGALNTALLFVFYSSQQGTPWFQNKVRDFGLLALFLVISGVIGYLTQNWKRKLELSVKQKNRVTGKDSSEYHQRVTGSKERTINLEVIIKRRKGLNFFLRQYLKGHNISILIECNPPGIELQVKDEALLNNVIPKDDRSGFHYDITDFIVSVSKHKVEAEPKRRLPYLIKETKDSRSYFNANVVCYVNPILVIDREKVAPWWIRLVLAWNPEQHKIEFYYEEKKETGEVPNAV